MKVVKHDLSKHKDGFELKPLSDLHLGQPAARPEKLEELIRWIAAEENRYTILVGDLCEIALRDSHGEIYEQRMGPHKQAEEVIRMFMPIKDRILGVVPGNHEDRIKQRTGFDIAMMYAGMLEAPYDPATMILALGTSKRDGLRYKTVMFTHGWSSARSIGPRLAMPTLLQQMVIDADVYITAHTHQPVAYPLDGFKVNPSQGTTTRITQEFIGLGSLLDHAEYAEKSGRRPTTMRFPRIEFIPDRHTETSDIHVHST